ncbi:MAG: CCA tRNA nucleotidyltransferase [Proteobacteria bacterium]|nr:CCA tRNA nucleotidyltransferase [Pseudomonadota bacterium]
MVSINSSRDPTGKLDPMPWLTAPETDAVMSALAAGGKPARFVGGCVRDTLAKRPVKDIDIATPEPPERAMQLMQKAGIRVIPTGLKHGTVTAIIGEMTFEVTTLRIDVETDGRRARIAYTDDWIADAARRDFTINALSANRDGDVFDYYEGISDLARGHIRFVGRAQERVAEDYLRILRFFRFYGHYGRPPEDTDGFAACRAAAEKLKTLSGERIRDELLKILLAPDPADVIILMKGAGVLEAILPEATKIGRLRSAAWLVSRGIVVDGATPDPLRCLAAVLGPDANAPAIAKRLRLSNHETSRLAGMCAETPVMTAETTAEEIKVLVHKHDGEMIRDRAILAWADRLADVAKLPGKETAARLTQVETAAEWSPPPFPLGGEDAKRLGVPAGPKIGRLLRAVEDWWSADGFRAERPQCLEILSKLTAGTGKEKP